MNATPLKLCLGITSLALAAGCASATDKPVMRELPPGTVAIAPARHGPVAYVETVSEAATRALDRPGTWAAAGAKWGFIGPAGAAFKNPIALPAVLLTPVTTAAGGLIGAVSGAVYSAFTIANDLPSYSVVTVPASGPASFHDTPDYQPLAEQHFDGVLELRVTRAGLLADLKDSDAPGTRDYFYISDYRPLTDWQDEDGRVIAAELDKACEELARQIAESTRVAATSKEAS